jgi:integrase
VESRGGLTDLKVRNFKPATQRVEVPDKAQRGLYLVVQPSGKRSFAVRYRLDGKPKKLTLTAGLTLADARRRASEIMYQIETGTDPRVAKRAETAKPDHTLQAIAERYLRREGGKLRSLPHRESALRRLVFPVLGARQIDSIRRGEITDLLDKIEDKQGQRSADLVLSYLRRIFVWHSLRDDSFLNPIVPGMSRYSISDNRRTRFLDDDEIRLLWQATADIERPCAAVLRFLLLTGARKSEATGLRRNEIDGDSWTLPKARHKNKRHNLTRPLSGEALAIVHAMPRIDRSPFVFTNNGTSPVDLSGAAARRFIRAIGIRGWRIHDLRRTARTLLSRAKVDSVVAERCLGHMPNGLIQTYDQHNFQTEMKHAFAELAALVKLIVNPPPANVTPMRRKRHAQA